MKILMLCDFYDENLEYQENLLVKYYRKHNHEVTIITSTFKSVFDYYAAKHDNSISPSEHYFLGAKIIRLKYAFNIYNRIRKYTSIYKILETEKPNLIYIHDIMPNMLEAVKYKKKNPSCRLIMDYHADYSNSGKNWISLRFLHGFIRKRIYLNPCKKHLSKIFPIVPEGAIFLNEIYNVPLEQMELLPLGADTDLGKEIKNAQEGKKIRNSLNIPQESFVIFTGGKLEPRKKTELLINAVIKLQRSNLHLIIVGDAASHDTSYKKSLEASKSSLNNIHFVGWQNPKDVYKFLDASNIAIFPASQSILWQQAISMDLPLIVGNTGRQSIEYLNKYGNIISLQKEAINVENLVENIQILLADDNRLKYMAIGAKRITDEMLNWDTLIAKTLQFNIDVL
jgi:1,2-diacylglycerol 3-alpha-glucosyltransferase